MPVIYMSYLSSVRSRWLDIGQVVFLRVYGQEEVEIHKNVKTEQGQYPATLTEQTWAIKHLLYGFRENFSSGIQRVVQSGQDGYILPAWVANRIAQFGSSCPLTKLAI